MNAKTKPQDKKAAAATPASDAGTSMVVLTGGAADQLPDYLRSDTSRGNENVGTNDLVIPRLELIQSLSPQRKKTDPAYIEGAEEGMMFNNVTGQLYADHVLIIPVFFRSEFLVWKDRKQGGGQGGFRGAFETREAAQHAIEELGEEHLLINDTHLHFCLLIDPKTNEVSEIAMSMAKSKLKISKKWNSLIRMLGGDRFSRVYKVHAVGDKNAKNEDFFNFAPITQVGFPSKELYDRALALYDTIAAGGVKVDRTGDDGEEVGAQREF